MTAVAERVAELVEPTLASMGYDLVRVQLSGSRSPILQVMAERRDEAGMTVDDCADISRAVSALLDVEDPIAGAYTLEVSSPGIDRPLVRRRDFERFAGFEAKVETGLPIDGRRRFKGTLLGMDGNDVRIALASGQEPADVRVPIGDVQKAKLLLTEGLLAASGGDAQATRAAQTAQTAQTSAAGAGKTRN